MMSLENLFNKTFQLFAQGLLLNITIRGYTNFSISQSHVLIFHSVLSSLSNDTRSIVGKSPQLSHDISQ